MNNSTGFSNIQYQKIYDSNMQYHYWNLYRNRFIYKTIKKFNINNILDIGCGRGIVTNYLHKKTFKFKVLKSEIILK